MLCSNRPPTTGELDNPFWNGKAHFIVLSFYILAPFVPFFKKPMN
jgi:hypothetical protein